MYTKTIEVKEKSGFRNLGLGLSIMILLAALSLSSCTKKSDTNTENSTNDIKQIIKISDKDKIGIQNIIISTLLITNGFGALLIARHLKK